MSNFDDSSDVEELAGGLGPTLTPGSPEAVQRRLEECLARIEVLEESLLESKGQLTQARSNNEKLTITIQQTREPVSYTHLDVYKRQH